MNKWYSYTIRACFLLAFLCSLLYQYLPINSVNAQDQSSEAFLSVTFDDGLVSTYENALPLLQNAGIRATDFVITGYVGRPYHMTWSQVQALQDQYGWEIGSHTVNHVNLKKVDLATASSEIVSSKIDLENHNLIVDSFAAPFGAMTNPALAEVMKVYSLQRGFWKRDSLNTYPYDRTDIHVKPNDTPQQIQAWISQAQSEKKWIVLVFHNVNYNPDPTDDTAVSYENFQRIVEIIRDSGIKTRTLREVALAHQNTNLLVNPTFDSGLSQGWQTDQPFLVKLDTFNNGSFPSSSNSVMIQSSAGTSHLYSPRIPVNSSFQYLISAFVNTNSVSVGKLGFNIDEYDSSGQWTGCRWLDEIYTSKVSYFQRIYQPSAAVSFIAVQTYLTANAQGQAFVDNYSVTDFSEFVVNGSFENTTQFPDAWQSDSSSFILDTNSQGNDGQKSMHLISNEISSHLFSDQIVIDPSHSYTWQQYLKIVSGGGDFGFYIDEYDHNGNWISGQDFGLLTTSFDGTKYFSYTPTNTRVTTIRLQYYVNPHATFDLYLDSVSLRAN